MPRAPTPETLAASLRACGDDEWAALQLIWGLELPLREGSLKVVVASKLPCGRPRIKRDKRGQIVQVGWVYKRKKVGQWVSFDSVGRVASRGFLRDGVREGSWEDVDDGGAERVVSAYAGGQRHGLTETFVRGILRLAEEWADDVRHGEHRSYNGAGQLIAQGEYTNGERDGLWRWWDTSGALIGERDYRGPSTNDRVETLRGLLVDRERALAWLWALPRPWDPIVEAYALSHLEEVGALEVDASGYEGWIYEGNPVGPWRHVLDDDTRESGVYNARGEREGRWSTVDAKDRLRRMETFRGGAREGVCRRWSAAGILIGETIYERSSSAPVGGWEVESEQAREIYRVEYGAGGRRRVRVPNYSALDPRYDAAAQYGQLRRSLRRDGG